MRVLWSIHLYPPDHNCGSEYVAHNVNKYLVSKGHECRVILHQAEMHKIRTPYMYEGVEVFGSLTYLDAYRWADVIMTHLDYTQYTILMAHSVKRPLFHFVHNDTEYSSISASGQGNYAVYNSQWIKDKIGYRLPSFVLHPPCDYDYYNVNENPFDNEYITLVNLDQNKGGKILRDLAKALPERKFIGVIGGYSSPAGVGQITDQPENVKIVANTPDILSVYKQTKILLMPSAYESWGRTATEAMCSGIPVICTPTPGLKENCGEAGIYIPERHKMYSMDNDFPVPEENYDIRPILKAIKDLDDKNYYTKVSEKCRERAKGLSPSGELEKLEQFMINAKNN
jgi:glycosyltransferase involved in cell wall biosynthesis